MTTRFARPDACARSSTPVSRAHGEPLLWPAGSSGGRASTPDERADHPSSRRGDTSARRRWDCFLCGPRRGSHCCCRGGRSSRPGARTARSSTKRTTSSSRPAYCAMARGTSFPRAWSSTGRRRSRPGLRRAPLLPPRAQHRLHASRGSAWEPAGEAGAGVGADPQLACSTSAGRALDLCRAFGWRSRAARRGQVARSIATLQALGSGDRSVPARSAGRGTRGPGRVNGRRRREVALAAADPVAIGVAQQLAPSIPAVRRLSPGGVAAGLCDRAGWRGPAPAQRPRAPGPVPGHAQPPSRARSEPVPKPGAPGRVGVSERRPATEPVSSAGPEARPRAPR